jgi:hypothetical protein
MTATDNSWVAATEAKLNATYALHIQETGRQPRAPVSELGLRLISKASGPRSDRVNGSAHDVCIGSNSEVQARNWGVRFTLKNRHRQPSRSGPKSAISGLMHRTKRVLVRSPRRRKRARAHSGNPAFRRPSVNSFAFDRPPRAIHADIVKAGSTSSIRAAASRASASRPRWAKADARHW